MHQIVLSIYVLATWFQSFFDLHNIIDENLIYNYYNLLYIILHSSDTVGAARNAQTYSVITSSLKFKGLYS